MADAVETQSTSVVCKRCGQPVWSWWEEEPLCRDHVNEELEKLGVR